MEGPQEQAADQAGQVGKQGQRATAQPGDGDGGGGQGEHRRLHQKHQKRDLPLPPLGQQVEEDRRHKGGDGPHTEGEQEAQGVDHEDQTGGQAGTPSPGHPDHIEGEEDAQGQEAGQEVGVAENAGDADALLIAGIEGVVVEAEQPGRKAGEGGAEDPCGGGVDAQQAVGGADRGGHGRQAGGLAPSGPEQHQGEDAEGGQDLTEFRRGEIAEAGVEAGGAVEDEIEEDGQGGEGEAVPGGPVGHGADQAHHQQDHGEDGGLPLHTAALGPDEQEEEDAQDDIPQGSGEGEAGEGFPKSGEDSGVRRLFRLPSSGGQRLKHGLRSFFIQFNFSWLISPLNKVRNRIWMSKKKDQCSI